MSTYYNEFDANAAQWLRNLGGAGEISQGVVDERSIKEVRGADLAGIRRAHFFAGIGGWDLALRIAGWPEDREVWTGSCPCQPYSSAGKKKGNADERNLWPAFFALISARRPKFIFGEQVASAIKHGWLDRVYADLEGIGYTCGAAVLGAHSVGAPHLRQRLYWVADCQKERRGMGHSEDKRSPDGEIDAFRNDSNARGMGQNPAGIGRGRGRDGDSTGDDGQIQAAGLCAVGGMADDDDAGQQMERPGRPQQNGVAVSSWSDHRSIPCTDGKARRTGSRVFPLAYGLPRGVGDGGTWRKGLARGASRARIGMLKGSGNAIVPALAAEFIRAFLEIA